MHLCLPSLLVASDSWCPKKDVRHLQWRGPNPYLSQNNPGFPAHPEVTNQCFYATDSRMLTLKQNIVRLWQKALFKNCQSHNRYLAVSQIASKLDLGYLWNQPLLRTQKLNIQYAPSTLKLWQAVLVEVAYSTIVLVDERLGALLEAGAPPTSTLSLWSS